MAEFRLLSANRLLFDLASRMGSLEGYLYAEDKVDTSYIPNWLQNIEQEFEALSAEVQKEIRSDYIKVLDKIHELLCKTHGEADPNTVKAAAMISAVAI
jgi:hypothetical protein